MKTQTWIKDHRNLKRPLQVATIRAVVPLPLELAWENEGKSQTTPIPAALRNHPPGSPASPQWPASTAACLNGVLLLPCHTHNPTSPNVWRPCHLYFKAKTPPEGQHPTIVTRLFSGRARTRGQANAPPRVLTRSPTDSWRPRSQWPPRPGSPLS